MPNKLCKYIFITKSPQFLPEVDDVNTLCTYRILNRGVTVCDEDHGHPLIFFDKIIGVLTQSAGCNGSPAIYTRISSYASWIAKILAN